MVDDQVTVVSTLEQESLPGPLNSADAPPLLANENTLVNVEPRDSTGALENIVRNQIGGGFAENVLYNDRTYRSGGVGGVPEWAFKLIEEVPEVEDQLWQCMDVYGQLPEIVIHVAGLGGGTGPAHCRDFRKRIAAGEFVQRDTNDPPLIIQMRLVPGPTDGRKPREHPDPDIDDGKVRAHNVISELRADQRALQRPNEGGDVLIVLDNRMSGLAQLANEQFLDAGTLQTLHEADGNDEVIDASGNLTSEIDALRQGGLGDGLTYPRINRGQQMAVLPLMTAMMDDPAINVGKITQQGIDRSDGRSDFQGMRIPMFAIQQSWQDINQRFRHARPESLRKAALKLAWYLPRVPLAPLSKDASREAYLLVLSSELRGGLPTELKGDIAREFARNTDTLSASDITVDAIEGLTDKRWPTEHGVPDIAMWAFVEVSDIVTPFEHRWNDVLNQGGDEI
jgi:hypothetical protein